MRKYANLNGSSGVDSYQYGSDYIQVQFTTGAVYTYSYSSAGASNIETMKVLADSGRGLNSFINKYVKFKYE